MLIIAAQYPFVKGLPFGLPSDKEEEDAGVIGVRLHLIVKEALLFFTCMICMESEKSVEETVKQRLINPCDMPVFRFWPLCRLLQRVEDSLVKVREVGCAKTGGEVPAGRCRIVQVIPLRDIKVGISTCVFVRDGVI